MLQKDFPLTATAAGFTPAILPEYRTLFGLLWPRSTVHWAVALFSTSLGEQHCQNTAAPAAAHQHDTALCIIKFDNCSGVLDTEYQM